jgi:hypothetical protein
MSWKIKFLTPRVGDRVKCIKNTKRKFGPKSDNNGYGDGWEEGYEFIVKEIFKNIAWPTGGGSGVYIDCLKRI